MHTICADPGQALCLIGTNIVRDYKDEIKIYIRDKGHKSYETDCYSSCDFASIMSVYCDSSREHYFFIFFKP